MKLRRVFLSLALLTAACLVAARPAAADSVLYDNTTSSSNLACCGTQIFYTLSGGELHALSDSFTLSSDSTVDGFTVNLWLLNSNPVDVSWEIGSVPYNDEWGYQFASYLVEGSASPVLGTPLATSKKPGDYHDLYGDYSLSFSIPALNLTSGQYWLSISSISSPCCQEAYWDVSSGPSTAYVETSSIPSNTFQILGSVNSPSGGTPNGDGSGLPNSVVPEPPSATLLGLGLVTLLIAGLFRKYSGPLTAGSMLA